MTWPLALLAILVGIGLWVPRRTSRRVLAAVVAIAVVLAIAYVGLGSPPPVAAGP